MITIKSKSYHKDDVSFVADVIASGLDRCCNKYSLYNGSQETICEGCTHKIACDDLRSSYYFMLSKAFRMFAEENTGKIDPLELELLDS